VITTSAPITLRRLKTQMALALMSDTNHLSVESLVSVVHQLVISALDAYEHRNESYFDIRQTARFELLLKLISINRITDHLLTHELPYDRRNIVHFFADWYISMGQRILVSDNCLVERKESVKYTIRDILIRFIIISCTCPNDSKCSSNLQLIRQREALNQLEKSSRYNETTGTQTRPRKSYGKYRQTGKAIGLQKVGLFGPLFYINDFNINQDCNHTL
jgi:hypothetical protein